MRNWKSKLTLNRQYIIFVLFLYFFLFKPILENSIPVFGYADELIALSAFPIAIVQLHKNHGRIWIRRGGGDFFYVVIYVVSGFLGNCIFRYQPMTEAALPDLLLNLKFWLCIYVGKNVLCKFSIHRYAKKIFNHIRFIAWLYTILIVVDNIHPMFPSSIRYGLRSTQLFYNHPTVFAANCVLLMVILLMIRGNVGIKKERMYFIWFSILVCSTLRSKMFGCVLAFWLIYYFVFYRKKKFRLRTLLLFVPLAIALGWGQIEYYFFSSIQQGSARYQLLMKSLDIANDHFPIGAGFGTFGSHYSAVVYSPLYRIYGVSRIYGLMEGSAAFVSDSYWPMVLGQCGWFGLIAILLAILMLFFRVQRLRAVNNSSYAAGLFILAYLLIESTASSAFVHPLSMPLAILLGYLLYPLDAKPK